MSQCQRVQKSVRTVEHCDTGYSVLCIKHEKNTRVQNSLEYLFLNVMKTRPLWNNKIPNLVAISVCVSLSPNIFTTFTLSARDKSVRLRFSAIFSLTLNNTVTDCIQCASQMTSAPYFAGLLGRGLLNRSRRQMLASLLTCTLYMHGLDRWVSRRP